MKRLFVIAVASVASFASVPSVPSFAESGDKFTWTQVKVNGAWDPYPQAWSEIASYLSATTSVPLDPARRIAALTDPSLFGSPFLVLSGKDAPAELSDAEVLALRRYLLSGGFLWLEDASGLRASPFDRWVRRSMGRVLPDAPFEVLHSTHAVFRSFYLLRSIGGRVLVQPSVEGINAQDRTLVMYTRNDLEGAWLKDSLGNFLYPCTPGGEPQRNEARKLTVNVILYALTGSYKLDAVHQPFILEKLRSMTQ